jgi:hypothetical protein
MFRVAPSSIFVAIIGAFVVGLVHHPLLAAEEILHDQAGEVPQYETWLIDNYEHAQDFVLTTPARLTHITAWLTEGRNPGNNNGILDGLAGISWGLYSNNVAQPGALITFGYDPLPGTVDTPLVFTFGGDMFRVNTALTTPVLSPGRYWISLHNGTWQSPNDSRIGWSTTLTKTFGFPHVNDDLRVPGKNWVGGSEQAFILYGEKVPEPSTVLLVLAAMPAIASRSRKSRGFMRRTGLE